MKNFLLLCVTMLLTLFVTPLQASVFEQDTHREGAEQLNSMDAAIVTAIAAVQLNTDVGIQEFMAVEFRDNARPAYLIYGYGFRLSRPLTTQFTPQKITFVRTGQAGHFLYYARIRGHDLGEGRC